MSSILNNLAALGASRQLVLTGANLNRTIQRLTTGKRINQASDDAAGLAISSKLGADVKIAGQAQRNTNDGVSYLQVADGALDEVTQLLTRASQLAQQAQTGTISDANRANLDAEFQNILKTVINIGQHANFNGQAIFSTTGAAASLSVQAGDYGTIAVELGSVSDSATSALGLSTATFSAGGTSPNPAWVADGNGGFKPAGVDFFSFSSSGYTGWSQSGPSTFATVPNWGAGTTGYSQNGSSDTYGLDTSQYPEGTWLSGLGAHNADLASLPGAVGTFTGLVVGADSSIPTQTGSGDALDTISDAAAVATKLSAALASVSTMRASLGANEAELNATSDVLGIQQQNFTAAQSQIQDANIADEVVNLTKFQILNQSGTSALAKADQAAQQILALMQ